LEDVKVGVITHKIAAHAADLARGIPGARERDDQISRARYDFRWEDQFALSLDPETARAYREERSGGGKTQGEDYCTMCGPEFCAMKLNRKVRQIAAEKGLSESEARLLAVRQCDKRDR
jgi:phosphomethylpyrimidine synthase